MFAGYILMLKVLPIAEDMFLIIQSCNACKRVRDTAFTQHYNTVCIYKPISLLLPNNLDTSVSLSVGMCRTTIGAKSSTVTAARALSPDATVLSTKKTTTKNRKKDAFIEYTCIYVQANSLQVCVV